MRRATRIAAVMVLAALLAMACAPRSLEAPVEVIAAPQPMVKPAVAPPPRAAVRAVHAPIHQRREARIPPPVADTVGVVAPTMSVGGLIRRLGDLPWHSRDDRVVALTFDDGPDPRHTPQILDVLARYDVRATFFVVGSQAERHPEIIREIVAQGHTVENHTWSHVRITGLDDDRFAVEVDRASATIGALAGRPIACVRPPFGMFDDVLVERLAARGLFTALWTGDTRDWSQPGVAAIVDAVRSLLEPGAVIILHDGGGDRRQTVEALPLIIDHVLRSGYHLVPMCAP